MDTYTITYQKTNRTFTYACLDAQVLIALEDIEPEECVISEKTVSLIRSIIGIADLSDDELTYVRNSIVRHFADKVDMASARGRMASAKGNEAKRLSDQAYADTTRMSMITAVIDNEKWNRGIAV